MVKDKKISPRYLEALVKYGRYHQDETVRWTDEVHIDPVAESHEWMLRKEGTQLSPDHLQEWNELGERRGRGEHIMLHHQFHGITKGHCNSR